MYKFINNEDYPTLVEKISGNKKLKDSQTNQTTF